MNTPICDFLKDYAVGNPIRLHMPGHKGTAHPEDITEVPGADVLYTSGGIIRESENNAAELFGTARTVYSVEGSSLSIRAMLYLLMLAAKENGKEPRILAGRNAHKVFITTAALLDIPVDWIYPRNGNYLSCDISPERLENLILENHPTAVYVTSPDYLGNLIDLPALSEVCHKHGVLLAVDNAHGAYLRFLPRSLHPMQNGADICCDSAHKTLPVLTGGSYLHIAHSAPPVFAENAERAMSLFASTSPSYLIMRSLDSANAILADGFRKSLLAVTMRLVAMCKALQEAGFTLVGSEPLKVTLATKPFGYTGEELYALLQKQNIYCEFADPDYLVMMFSPNSGTQTVDIVEKALLSIPHKTPIVSGCPDSSSPISVIRPHDALFADTCTLPLDQCVGKVLASATVSCPPAVPIISIGERIEADILPVLRYYGVDVLNVLRNEVTI